MLTVDALLRKKCVETTNQEINYIFLWVIVGSKLNLQVKRTIFILQLFLPDEIDGKIFSSIWIPGIFRISLSCNPFAWVNNSRVEKTMLQVRTFFNFPIFRSHMQRFKKTFRNCYKRSYWQIKQKDISYSYQNWSSRTKEQLGINQFLELSKWCEPCERPIMTLWWSVVANKKQTKTVLENVDYRKFHSDSSFLTYHWIRTMIPLSKNWKFNVLRGHILMHKRPGVCLIWHLADVKPSLGRSRLSFF